MIKERRIDAERLARVETRLDNLDEKQDGQTEAIGKMAGDVTDIKIMLAEERGKQKMFRYGAHAAAVIMGSIGGFFGGSIK